MRIFKKNNLLAAAFKITAVVIFLITVISCSGTDGISAGETPGTAAAVKKYDFTFSGANALKHVTDQVALGPRTSANGKQLACAEYISSKLKSLGFETSLQSFTGDSGMGAGVKFYNVIATFNPANKSGFKVFGAHYDTLPYAPRDTDPQKQRTPIDGANDGASGVAVLLELARAVSQKKAALDSGVKLVFFDGEDFYTGMENMFYGSKYFAASLKPEDRAAIKYFVLVDMVGDSDLGIYKDQNSQSANPDFNNYIFAAAKELGLKGINDSVKYEIADDHIPMIAAKITSALLIDFDYPAWHTTRDTADLISAESLEQSGKLLEYLVFN